MKVESMQQVNSSYQSQGSANVAAQAVPAKSGTASTNDMSMQQKAKDAVTITEDGVKTGNVREDGQASNEQIRQAVIRSIRMHTMRRLSLASMRQPTV